MDATKPLGPDMRILRIPREEKVSLAEREERIWFARFMQSCAAGYGEEPFSWKLQSCYVEAFLTHDYPEFTDTHFRESLIKGFLQADVDGQKPDWNADCVHWCFCILSRSEGRSAAICELRERFVTGYAAERLEVTVARWAEEEASRTQEQKAELEKKRAESSARVKALIDKQEECKRTLDWQNCESHEHWCPSGTLERFIKKIREDDRNLLWHEFVEKLVPTNSAQPDGLRQHLRNIARKPSVYWYPGSGMDIKPLALDVPNNPLGRRLFRINEPDYAEDPVIFWMNDHGGYQNLSEEPKQKLTGGLDLVISVGDQREDYVFNECIPVTLFTVGITNKRRGEYDRPINGDHYLVILSKVPSHILFEEVFFPGRLRVACVLLAAQGGFSMQLRGFQQYRDIPKLLSLTEQELGPVDVFLLDGQAHNSGLRRPNSPYIRHYEQLGGSVRLGWDPCRAFLRPGLTYWSDGKPRKRGMLAFNKLARS